MGPMVKKNGSVWYRRLNLKMVFLTKTPLSLMNQALRWELFSSYQWYAKSLRTAKKKKAFERFFKDENVRKRIYTLLLANIGLMLLS